MKVIRFTEHALRKFTILEQHGFPAKEEQVLDTLHHPDRIEMGEDYSIAQKRISEKYVLRVVYSHQEGVITVITFYPGRRSRYEDQL